MNAFARLLSVANNSEKDLTREGALSLVECALKIPQGKKGPPASGIRILRSKLQGAREPIWERLKKDILGTLLYYSH